jgi:chromodomain-helicase-DNA-binding protein 4
MLSFPSIFLFVTYANYVSQLSEHKLLKLRNGQNALNLYNANSTEISNNNESSTSNEEPSMDLISIGKRTRTRITKNEFVNSGTIQLGSDEDELHPDRFAVKRRRLGKESGYISMRSSTRQSSRNGNASASKRPTYDEQSLDSDDALPQPHGTSKILGLLPSTRSSTRTTRSANIKPGQTRLRSVNKSQPQYFDDINDDEDEADELAGKDQDDSENSDIVFKPKKQQHRPKDRRGRSTSKGTRGRPRKYDSSSSSAERAQPSRRSGRDRVIKNMKERDMDEEIYADDAPSHTAPKVISVREIFQPISKQDPFVLLHSKSCDVCKGVGTNSNKGHSPLVYCQGCSAAIHKACLGYRSGREHLVTKVGHEHFVMQCRRCIGIATKKDAFAPRLGSCQSCKKEGRSCAEFSVRRTAKQEEKLRIENDNEDPITTVLTDLINNPENILFRCVTCQQAFHFEHLPPLSTTSKNPSDVEKLHRARFKEYAGRWQCKDCLDTDAKVQSLVAWRPTDPDSYVDGQEADDFREDEKEYLVKWEEQSYFQCSWMPGSWVWGVTAATMRKAFFKRDEGTNNLPKWTEEEAIPEEFLRIEIVLDVKYDDDFQPRSEVNDKAAINMVESVYVKFQGLGYEEAAWQDPPDPNDEDRWSDFVAAYHEYVVGQYFKQPPAATMKERIDSFRSKNFEKKIEVKKQTSALSGGDMMTYQIEGLNWLLYNFHQKKNVILADEMGLGKTIQIISLIASLVKDNPKVILSLGIWALKC